MSKLDYDFHEFHKLMQQTADNLRKMTEMQRAMRWQYGGTDNEAFANLAKEMEIAEEGWMSSAC
jgi:hypothetical protein